MKKIITVLLSFLFVFSLAACKQEASKPEEKGKLRVSLWHTYTEDQQVYLEKTIADFNASQTEIEVIAESQPRQDFESKVMQAVRSGTGPDMIIHYASEAANYVKDNLVIDFSSYADEDFKKTIDAGVLAEATSFEDRQMHILPLFSSGPVFFYNVGIYEELQLKVPTTWEELTINSQKIKEAYPDKYGFAADSLTDLGQMLFSQNGNSIVDVETRMATFHTAENTASLDWYAQGVKDGYFMLAPSEQYFSSDFNAGILASYIGSVAGAPYLTEGLWAAAPLPQGGKIEWTSAWNRGIIIFKSDETKESAAVSYAKYLASPEVNANFCAIANYPSPYTTTREVEVYQKLLESNAPLAALRPETAGSFPAISGISSVRKAIEKAFTEVSTGQKTADQALQDAVAEANNALKN